MKINLKDLVARLLISVKYNPSHLELLIKAKILPHSKIAKFKVNSILIVKEFKIYHKIAETALKIFLKTLLHFKININIFKAK